MAHYHTLLNNLDVKNLAQQTVTFDFTPSEPFPVQCSIDGGPFFNCECTICNFIM